jgi:hypothetical protein
MAAIISSAMAPWAVVCGVHMVIRGVFTAVRNVIMGAAQSVVNPVQQHLLSTVIKAPIYPHTPFHPNSIPLPLLLPLPLPFKHTNHLQSTRSPRIPATCCCRLESMAKLQFAGLQCLDCAMLATPQITPMSAAVKTNTRCAVGVILRNSMHGTALGEPSNVPRLDE